MKNSSYIQSLETRLDNLLVKCEAYQERLNNFQKLSYLQQQDYDCKANEITELLEELASLGVA